MKFVWKFEFVFVMLLMRVVGDECNVVDAAEKWAANDRRTAHPSRTKTSRGNMHLSATVSHQQNWRREIQCKCWAWWESVTVRLVYFYSESTWLVLSALHLICGIVWRTRGKIIRTVLGCIMYHNCTQSYAQLHTHMSRWTVGLDLVFGMFCFLTRATLS